MSEMGQRGPHSTELELYDQDRVDFMLEILPDDSVLRRTIVFFAGSIERYRDGEELRRKNAELEARLGVDVLTGAMSREAFDGSFERFLRTKSEADCHMPERRTPAAQRANGLALLYLDLDGFKAINDTYGHDDGDTVLKKFVIGMREVLREDDLIGRRGGDEFVVLLNQGIDQSGMELVCERVLEMTESIDVRGREGLVGVSIGGVLHKQAYTTESMMTAADARMMAAKQKGKNQAVLEYVDVPVE